MTIASGIQKQLVIKKESAWGTAPGATGAQYLRRVTSDIDLMKDTYESQEIVTHQQVVDFRHGVKRVNNGINGELSLGTYELFLEALLRKTWATGATTGSVAVVAADSGGTFTRSTGSFFTDGFKVGDVMQWTGFVATGNNGYNYRITALTATVMTVSGTVTTEAEGASVTGTVVGKKLWVSTSSQTDDSFAIEHYYSDLAESELFLGCKIAKATINLPPTGMATIGFDVMGRSVTPATSAAYYTTPTAATTTSILAAVNGTLRQGSSDIAVVTGLNLDIDGGYTAGDPVVGSNLLPFIFQGRLRVSGTMSAYFEDTTLRDAFYDETETSLNVKLDATSATDTDCMIIDVPRIKFGGAAKDDGEKGLVQNIPFTALLNNSGGSGTSTEETTISIQDSTLS